MGRTARPLHRVSRGPAHVDILAKTLSSERWRTAAVKAVFTNPLPERRQKSSVFPTFDFDSEAVHEILVS